MIQCHLMSHSHTIFNQLENHQWPMSHTLRNMSEKHEYESPSKRSEFGDDDHSSRVVVRMTGNV